MGRRIVCPARRTGETIPLIYVFCEGESEQEYVAFLRKQFSGVVKIKCHAKPFASGVFEMTKAEFQKNEKYREEAEVIDEIWLFLDIEAEEPEKWDSRWKCIRFWKI